MAQTVDEKTAGRRSQEAVQKPQVDERLGQDFASILEEFDQSSVPFSEGDVVHGRVLKVSPDWVVVDVGFKSEGLIPASEFKDDSGEVNVKAGDQVDVLLESIEPDGSVILSREKAERMRIWDKIEKAFNEQTVLKGTVVDRVKGGLSVDIGVKAFLPGSQVDMQPVRNLDSFKGEEI
ncbi:MAG TPA: S1 RNA-binding domain-containing protein, partial [Acidobacteriota bacterium]|nr:S1 RNA-binding domain-containing protein [Acidobacteriota bacterium]